MIHLQTGQTNVNEQLDEENRVAPTKAKNRRTFCPEWRLTSVCDSASSVVKI
jgi:hypothetical protein